MLRSRLLIRRTTDISRFTLAYWSRALRLLIRARLYLSTAGRRSCLILVVLVRRLTPIWRCALTNMTMALALSCWCCPLRSILRILHQIVITWRVTTPIQLLLISQLLLFTWLHLVVASMTCISCRQWSICASLRWCLSWRKQGPWTWHKCFLRWLCWGFLLLLSNILIHSLIQTHIGW